MSSLKFYLVTSVAQLSPMGVNTDGQGTVYVNPGQTVTVPISDVEAKAIEDHAPWFKIQPADGAAPAAAAPPHPDDAAAIVNPTGPSANDLIAAAALAEGGLEQIGDDHARPNFDAMTVDQLKAYLTDADVGFHPNTGHPKLVEKAGETWDALEAKRQEDEAASEGAGDDAEDVTV